MRYSEYAKIIDKDSEYYGKVFEVSVIYLPQKCIDVFIKGEKISLGFPQIQFCVTKDGEPVKIGEEYLCLQDLVNDGEIYDWIEFVGEIEIYVHQNCKYGKDDHSFEVTDDLDFSPLHPTNKIKITAEGKEYLVSREEFNRIIK